MAGFAQLVPAKFFAGPDQHFEGDHQRPEDAQGQANRAGTARPGGDAKSGQHVPNDGRQAEAEDEKSQMAQALSGGRVSTEEQGTLPAWVLRWGEYITPRNMLSIIGLGRSREIFTAERRSLPGGEFSRKFMMRTRARDEKISERNFRRPISGDR